MSFTLIPCSFIQVRTAVTLASTTLFRSLARCCSMAFSIDPLTHQYARPKTTAAMIGHTQSTAGGETCALRICPSSRRTSAKLPRRRGRRPCAKARHWTAQGWSS